MAAFSCHVFLLIPYPHSNKPVIAWLYFQLVPSLTIPTPVSQNKARLRLLPLPQISASPYLIIYLPAKRYLHDTNYI